MFSTTVFPNLTSEFVVCLEMMMIIINFQILRHDSGLHNNENQFLNFEIALHPVKGYEMYFT